MTNAPAEPRSRRGRPSKGDRHKIVSLVPREAADPIMTEADQAGVTYGEMLAYYACKGKGIDMPYPRGKNATMGQAVLDFVNAS